MHTVGNQHSWGTYLATGTGTDQCGHIHENTKATCITSHVPTQDYTAGHLAPALQTRPSLLPSATSSGLGGHPRGGSTCSPALSCPLGVPHGAQSRRWEGQNRVGLGRLFPRLLCGFAEPQFKPRPVPKAWALGLGKSELAMDSIGS